MPDDDGAPSAAPPLPAKDDAPSLTVEGDGPLQSPPILFERAASPGPATTTAVDPPPQQQSQRLGHEHRARSRSSTVGGTQAPSPTVLAVGGEAKSPLLSPAVRPAAAATTSRSASPAPASPGGAGGLLSILSSPFRRNSMQSSPAPPPMSDILNARLDEEMDIDAVLRLDPEEEVGVLEQAVAVPGRSPTASPKPPLGATGSAEMADGADPRASNSPSSESPGASAAQAGTSGVAGTSGAKKTSAFKDMRNALVNTTVRLVGRRSKSLRRASSLKRDSELPDGEGAPSDGPPSSLPSQLGANDSAMHSSTNSVTSSSDGNTDAEGPSRESPTVRPQTPGNASASAPPPINTNFGGGGASGTPSSPVRRSNSHFGNKFRKLFSANSMDKDAQDPAQATGTAQAPAAPSSSPPAPSPALMQQASEVNRSGIFRSVSVSARSSSSRHLIAARNVPRINVGERKVDMQFETPVPASAPAQVSTDAQPAAADAPKPVPATPTTPAVPDEPTSAEVAQRQKDEAKQRKRLQVRAYIVEELLSTERNYVHNLRIVLDLFVKPLIEAAETDRPIISKVDIKLIFSCIEDLYEVNSRYLEDLEQVVSSWTNESAIGALFNKHFEGSDVYVKFVDSYSSAKSAIRRSEERSSAYRSFVQDLLANPECHRQGISDHLILPVQRVTRYVMLLADLVKNTEPTHTDYPALVQALESMRKLSHEVNEAKRKEESMTQMFLIQKLIAKTPPTLISASRRYIAEYEMVEFTVDTFQPFRSVMLFVFTDVLMVARASSKNWTSSIRNMAQLNVSGRQKSYKFDKLLPLRNMTAHVITEKDGTADKLLFKVIPEGSDSMVFQAAAPNDRTLIVGQINEHAKLMNGTASTRTSHSSVAMSASHPSMASVPEGSAVPAADAPSAAAAAS